MATSGLNFAAAIDDWVRASNQRLLAVFRESTQRVVSIAQFGPPTGIPVDTGFARASIRASTDVMPQIDPTMRRPDNVTRVPYDPGDVTAAIAGAKLGDTIFVGWTANYVGFLEYGSSQKAPNGFVRLAAAQWQHVVTEVVDELKSRAT